MDKSEKNSNSNKIQGRFKKFLYIFILVFSIALLAVEGVVYYQRKYLTPFWVNGQSMYPTLNGNAKNAKGEEIGAKGGGARAGYTVDYGVMDTHAKALKKIKRFDIIITTYSEDDTSCKIKRVIGLPGEKLQFNTTKARYGDLYINGEYVEQPIATEYIRAGKGYPSNEIVLGADEYYVLGDNRGYSQDSRREGAIKKNFIKGKAVAICGTCEVYLSDQSTLDIKNIKYTWPKYLK